MQCVSIDRALCLPKNRSVKIGFSEELLLNALDEFEKVRTLEEAFFNVWKLSGLLNFEQ